MQSTMNVWEIIEDNYWLFPNIIPEGTSKAILSLSTSMISHFKRKTDLSLDIEKDIDRIRMLEYLLECADCRHFDSICKNINMPDCNMFESEYNAFEKEHMLKILIKTANNGVGVNRWQLDMIKTACKDFDTYVDYIRYYYDYNGQSETKFNNDLNAIIEGAGTIINLSSERYGRRSLFILLESDSLSNIHTKDPCIITQIYLLYTLVGRHEEVVKWINDQQRLVVKGLTIRH